ncbi:MAG: MATE family efflux transporter [Tannerellaceae bacterium]|nr:MATE family efflux transporter [Tannerellaceae bacterium]
MSIGKLFAKQLFPTIMGMVAAALLTVVDGIFVGNGIGSDALAAVNFSAPLFMLFAGTGLMFGMGGGILASIHLSRGKNKVANINLTQSVVAALVVSLVITFLFMAFPHTVARLLGSDEYLIDRVVEYLFWFSLGIPLSVLVVALPFFIRLTSPKVSMWAMLIATLVNIVLDYVFIFTFKWGLFGAAIATDIGAAVGAAIMVAYLLRRSAAVRFVRLKMSVKSFLLTFRNVRYMVKLGTSVFLSEITISVMIMAGNVVFMRYLSADGVAAYSIVCYLFPVIFMIFNATVQSAQPIISYNYGCGQMERSNKALRMAAGFAAGFALFIMLLFVGFAQSIVSLFIPDTNSMVWQYAVDGLPLFAVDYLFFGINIVTIGYYASIERLRRTLSLTVLRGIMPIVFFFTLPLRFGVPGIWLAVAAGDVTITCIITTLLILDRKRRAGSRKQRKERLFSLK